MIEEIDFHGPDALGKIELAMYRQRAGAFPHAALPVPAALGDFADVDFGVEIGGEGLAMAAGVGVDDVEGVDFVELVLVQPGGVDIGHAGVEAAAQQRHDAALAETILVGPLPLVLELGLVQRLVIGGVQVVDARGEAGVHDVQVLVGQRDIDHHLGLHALDQRHHARHVVGIHLRGVDRPRDLRRDLAALLLGAAGERDL